MGRSTCLAVCNAQVSLMCKFPCLINPPCTNLEWPASFCGLSSRSLYGGQFTNQARTTLRKGNHGGWQRLKVEGIHTVIFGSLRGQEKRKGLRVCKTCFATLFTGCLRINNYPLVEDDQISPRKKLIRPVLIGLL